MEEPQKDKPTRVVCFYPLELEENNSVRGDENNDGDGQKIRYKSMMITKCKVLNLSLGA